MSSFFSSPTPPLSGDAHTCFKLGQLCASFSNRMCSKENTIRKQSEVLHTVKPVCM